MPPCLAAGAVVIQDAVCPFAPQLAIDHAADQCRVLARHRRLVAVAVKSPGLHLALVELAAMQQPVERVLVVVALRTHRADGRFQLVGGHQRGHSRISMPSLSDLPAGPLDARSFRAAFAQHRIGVVDVHEHSFRFTSRPASAAIDPSGRQVCAPYGVRSCTTSLANHLVVRVEGAVEQNQRGAAQPVSQRRVHCGQGGM